MKQNRSVSFHLCSIRMRLPLEKAAQTIALLESVTGITRAKKGCKLCSVSCDVADDELLSYTEIWDESDGFNQHVCSDVFQRVLVAMDQCSEEPEVVFGMLSGKTGIASLQELHKSASAGMDRLSA